MLPCARLRRQTERWPDGRPVVLVGGGKRRKGARVREAPLDLMEVGMEVGRGLGGRGYGGGWSGVEVTRTPVMRIWGRRECAGTRVAVGPRWVRGGRVSSVAGRSEW